MASLDQEDDRLGSGQSRGEVTWAGQGRAGQRGHGKVLGLLLPGAAVKTHFFSLQHPWKVRVVVLTLHSNKQDSQKSEVKQLFSEGGRIQAWSCLPPSPVPFPWHPCIGLNSGPLSQVMLFLKSPNVTLFRNKDCRCNYLRLGHSGVGWAPDPIWLVPL